MRVRHHTLGIISNGLACQRSLNFSSFLHPRYAPTLPGRLSSSSANQQRQGGGYKIDHGDAELARSSNESRPIYSRRVSSKASKQAQQKHDSEARSTGNRDIDAQNILVAREEQSSPDQELPVHKKVAQEHGLVELQSWQHDLITTSTNSVNNTGARSDNSRHLNLPSHQDTDEYQIKEPGALTDPHYLDVLRPQNMIDLSEEPALHRHKKALTHDSLRTKDSWSYDWTVPLLALEDAVTKRKSTAIEEILASDEMKINLVDNSYLGVPVSSIPMPKIWTKATFAQHVYDLVGSRMPTQLYRQHNMHADDQEMEPHQIAIRDRLENVMFLPENAELVSSEALELAMRFYYRFKFLPSIRRLSNYIGKIEAPFSDRFVDNVLRYAATDKDMHNFTSFLRRALVQGFAPTEMTWTSLLICLSSTKAQRIVLDRMYKHKLVTQEQTRRDVASLELKMALEDTSHPLNVEELINKVVARHGQDWLTLTSGNIMLKDLCQLPAGQPIVDFLEIMVRHECIPNIDSMHILLYRCARITNFYAALTVLIDFVQRFNVVPDGMAYGLLFRAAWNSRFTNTCKILWTAICLHQRVSRFVRQRVYNSLVAKEPASLLHAWHRWRWMAGRLIVGNIPDLTTRKLREALLSQITATKSNQTSVAEIASSLHISHGDHAEQQGQDATSIARRRRYALNLIQHDESLHQQFYYPIRVALNDLQQAVEMDQEWKAKGINTLPLDRQLELMLRPHVVRRRAKRNAKGVFRRLGITTTTTA